MATNVNVLDRLPDIAIPPLHWVVRSFEDPIGTERPLWRDYSRYQIIVDFDIARLMGVLGMFARMGISWGYQDPYFVRNYSEAGRVQMYRSSYHVPYPDQPIVRQADNWYSQHPVIDIVPRCIDLELSRDCHPEQIADFTWRFVELIRARDGISPIIYSRYTLINNWLVPYWTEEMLNSVWWFLAQYRYVRTIEHAGPPTLPINIHEDRVILHQTADKKPGFPGEVQSNSVDYGRWELGDVGHMYDWIEQNWGGQPVEPPDWEPVEPIKLVMNMASALNVRAKPTVDSTDLGELIGSSIVPVIDEENDFYRIDGWIHKGWTKDL